ncbi:MAG: hypothetical protein EXS24_00455 [Pedosphaera sp.]|nr:hypothetical protein [Pedosphaera sp.]
MKKSFPAFCLLAGVIVAGAADAKKPALQVAEIKRVAPVDFQNEILPVFRSNCLACHNRTKPKAELVLETPQDILKGGESGKAVIPGDADKSYLFKLAAHRSDPPMPPPDNKVSAKSLTAQELGLIKLWINQGAKGIMREAKPIDWQPLPPGLNPVYSVSVTSDGQFAAAGRANQIFLYHLPTDQLVERLTDPVLIKAGIYGKLGVAHRDLVHSLAFNPAGDRLASGGYREVKIWKRQPAQAAGTLANVVIQPGSAVSPDGKRLAVAMDGNVIGLYELPAMKLVKNITGHTGPVNALQFSPDSARLASTSLDHSLRIWNVADATPFASTNNASTNVTALIWVAAGKQLATGHADTQIRVWKLPELANGGFAAPREIKGHTGPVTSLAAVSGGLQMVSGSIDASIRHWDVEKGTVIRQMAQGAPVRAVAVSSDSKRFASASDTGVAKLWDAATGLPVAELKGRYTLRESLAEKERLLTFTKGEVPYHQGDLKAKQENQKKVQERLAKAKEIKEKAEKEPIAEKKTILDKAEAEKKTAEEGSAKLKAETPKATEVSDLAEKVAKEVEAAGAVVKTASAKPIADQATAEKDAVAKRLLATTAKQTLDGLIANKQKTGEVKLVAADKAVVDAAAANKIAEQELTVANTETAKAKLTADTTETAAKTIEAKAKAVKDDAAKPAAEKDKAAQEAAVARKAATDAKTAYDNGVTTKQKPAILKADTAAKALIAAQAAKVEADKALVAAKAEVAAATKILADSDKAATDGEKAALLAKTVADKARTDLANADKLAADKRKLATDTKAVLTKLGADEKIATDKAAAAVKAVEAADVEFKKLDQPRQAAVTEFNLSTNALFRADDEIKQATTSVSSSEAAQKQAETIHEAAKKVATEAETPSTSLAFSADGLLVLTGGADQHLNVWASSNGNLLESIKTGESALQSVVAAGPGQAVVISADRKAVLWGYQRTWLLERTLGTGDAKSPIADRVNVIRFRPDGLQLATGSGEPSRGGEIKLWDVNTGALVKDLPDVHSDAVLGMAFSANGQMLVTGASDKFVKVTDLTTGKVTKIFEGHTHHVLGVGWSYDGRTLLSGGADNEIKSWNMVTGERGPKTGGFGKEITSIQFIGLTDSAIVTGADSQIKLVKAGTALQTVRNYAGSTDFVYAAAATPSGNIVVAGGQDSVLRVWEGGTAKLIGNFAPPPVQP